MKFNIHHAVATLLTSTSAFRLRSETHVVSFCRFRSSSSIETSSKRFLFDQKLNNRYFQDKEYYAPKKYKKIRHFLSITDSNDANGRGNSEESNDDGGDDRKQAASEVTAMKVDAPTTVRSATSVFVAVDGLIK